MAVQGLHVIGDVLWVLMPGVLQSLFKNTEPIYQRLEVELWSSTVESRKNCWPDHSDVEVMGRCERRCFDMKQRSVLWKLKKKKISNFNSIEVLNSSLWVLTVDTGSRWQQSISAERTIVDAGSTGKSMMCLVVVWKRWKLVSPIFGGSTLEFGIADGRSFQKLVGILKWVEQELAWCEL